MTSWSSPVMSSWTAISTARRQVRGPSARRARRDQQRLGGAALTHDLLRDAFAAAVKDWKKRKENWKRRTRRCRRRERTQRGVHQTYPRSSRNSISTSASTQRHLRQPSHPTSAPMACGRITRARRTAARTRGCGGWSATSATARLTPSQRRRSSRVSKRQPASRPRPHSRLSTRVRSSFAVMRASTLGRSIFRARSRGHFLLKMSSPLCRGDFWEALEPVMDRLIVIRLGQRSSARGHPNKPPAVVGTVRRRYARRAPA